MSVKNTLLFGCMMSLSVATIITGDADECWRLHEEFCQLVELDRQLGLNVTKPGLKIANKANLDLLRHSVERVIDERKEPARSSRPTFLSTIRQENLAAQLATKKVNASTVPYKKGSVEKTPW